MVMQGVATRVNAGDRPRDSLRGLKAALHASGVVGVWNWDHQLRTVRFDHGAALLITGRADLEGRDISGLDPIAQACVHPDDKDWLNGEMLRAVRTGSIILAEYRVRGADGRVRWLLSRGRVLRSEDGEPMRSDGILIDVTDHHERGEAGYLLVSSAAGLMTLADAADHCLRAHESITASGSRRLRSLMDELLLTLGKELAQVAAGRHDGLN